MNPKRLTLAVFLTAFATSALATPVLYSVASSSDTESGAAYVSPASVDMVLTQLGGVPYQDSTGVAGVLDIPVPAALWLFGSGLLGLVAVARRKRN